MRGKRTPLVVLLTSKIAEAFGLVVFTATWLPLLNKFELLTTQDVPFQ
jgi:hypothetical protein